jgi:hypothetical protein
MINQGQLRAPVIGKTSQMRNDEWHVGVFLGQQLDHRNLAHHVVHHRQREGSRGFADFAGERRVVAMRLYPDEAVARDRFLNHRCHTTAIALRMDEDESVKAVGTAPDNPRDFAIGDRVIGMKGGEQRRAVNARSGGPPQIFCERRIGIPRAGQPVAFSGMTMAINDHY